MTNLDEMRGELTVERQTILDLVWRYFIDPINEQDSWIRSGILYYRLGNGMNERLVHETLQPLGGTVIYETPNLGNGKRYILTALGVLLTEAGPQIEYVMTKYLHYVKRQYIESAGRVQKTPLVKVAEEFEFSEEQTYLLKRTISVFHDLFGGGSLAEPNIPTNLADNLVLIEDADLQVYLQHHELQKFDPTAPVDRNPFEYHDMLK